VLTPTPSCRMTIVIAETDDDALLAGYYHRHWLSMGLAPADVAPAWRERALEFIAAARRGRAFAGFVAREAGGPVGGACCHLVERAYPGVPRRRRAGRRLRLGRLRRALEPRTRHRRRAGARLPRPPLGSGLRSRSSPRWRAVAAALRAPRIRADRRAGPRPGSRELTGPSTLGPALAGCVGVSGVPHLLDVYAAAGAISTNGPRARWCRR
jgi:hypothetical protein